MNCADLQGLESLRRHGEGHGRTADRVESQGCALEGFPWTGIVKHGSEGAGWRQDNRAGLPEKRAEQACVCLGGAEWRSRSFLKAPLAPLLSAEA